MMCYQDRTFCTFYKECLDGEGCPRALNEEVIRKARNWIGTNIKYVEDIEGIPICKFLETPSCFREEDYNE